MFGTLSFLPNLFYHLSLKVILQGIFMPTFAEWTTMLFRIALGENVYPSWRWLFQTILVDWRSWDSSV